MNSEKPKPKFGPRKSQLTVKQETFAQKLAAGMHFTQAFRESYNCDNYKSDTNVYKRAHIERNHPKIQARVAELKEMIEKACEAKLTTGRLPRPSAGVPDVVNDAARAHYKVVQRVIMDRQKVTEMLLEDRQGARENGQYSAAVGAVKVVAQLHGLISDSRENRGETSDIERMDVDQLRAYIRGKLPEVGLNPSDVGLDFISMDPVTKSLN